MRLATSATPISRTPGHFSNAISLQAVKTDRPSGATNSVHRRRATSARALQRTDEVVLKAVQMCLQTEASSPDGPAEPLYLKTALLMKRPVMSSKMTGCESGVVDC